MSNSEIYQRGEMTKKNNVRDSQVTIPLILFILVYCNLNTLQNTSHKVVIHNTIDILKIFMS